MKFTLQMLGLLVAGAALRPPLPAQAAPASPQAHRLAPATLKAGRLASYQPPVSHTISGYVFEDVTYGGGAGRALGTAGTVGRANARVELYTSSGSFVAAATTDAGGYYSFPTSTGNYTVRVVNNTVTSSRLGYTSSLVPVQTYNNNSSNNSNVVGGKAPDKADAGANTSSAALSSLTTPTTIAQSQATVSADAANVNFGFNFDTVVNTNDAGQGSLRQFILNANALGGEESLSQSGFYTDARNLSADNPAAGQAGVALPAGYESSIFMIPTSALTADVAVIAPATALPQLTGPGTAVNGATQTYNMGNTNAVLLGAGGTVGTRAAALSQLSGPEVQLTGSASIAFGLDVAASATNSRVSGLAIFGFGNIPDDDGAANIRSAASGVAITQNVLGTGAASFAAPATPTNADNVRLTGGTSGLSVSNNLIGFANGKGITIIVGVSNVQVTGNEVRGNGQGGSNCDGIDIKGNSCTLQNNLFTGTSSQGIDSYQSAGGNVIAGNTVTDNGRGTDKLPPAETAGIRVYGPNNRLAQNIISGNYGAGIMLEGTTDGGYLPAVSNTLLSQNAIFGNGSVAARNGAAASGQLGIDLQANGDNELTGSSPCVTLNGAATTGANGLLHYPVLRTARLSGSTLVLTGYAKPGATIELFLAQANPASLNATGANFGQGKTYLFTLTEGTNDTDAGTGLSYSGPINGFDQGADTNANGFSFSITLTSAQQALVQAGALLTGTATLSGATSEFSGLVRVANAPAPLPVVLTAFTAQAVASRDAQLSWTTASEVNNDHFEVERSFDGAAFAKIGTVAGRGTTAGAATYTFTDAGVAARAAGPVYYRLRQVDLGGAGTYSPVRAVPFAPAATVALAPYPNPATDRTTLDLSALDAATTVRAQLLDATGRVVRSWALAGGRPQELPLRDLTSGAYLLVVASTRPGGSPLHQILRLSRL